MPTISNTELITNDIIARLRTISTANGYRNNVAFVSKVSTSSFSETEFPQLFLYPLDSKITAEDGASTSYLEKTRFCIEGYVKTELDTQQAGNLGDAMESLIHDVKKLLSTLPTYFINNHYWWVAVHDDGFEIDRAIDFKQMQGAFQIRIMVGSYSNDDFDARTSS
jgi:hypothetical protein